MASKPALTPHSAPQTTPAAGFGARIHIRRATTRKYTASAIKNTANTRASTCRSSPFTKGSVSRLAAPKASVGGSASRHRMYFRYFQHSAMQNSWLVTMASVGASIISK